MFLPSLMERMTLITVMREFAFLSLAGCSDHMSHEAKQLLSKACSCIFLFS